MKFAQKTNAKCLQVQRGLESLDKLTPHQIMRLGTQNRTQQNHCKNGTDSCDPDSNKATHTEHREAAGCSTSIHNDGT